MADATGHIRVETIIDQSLQAGLNSLSASIGATTGRITALNSVSRRLSESSRGLNASLKFLGETERGVHSITQALAVSQTTLASHFAQVRREANAFNAVLRSNSSASKANASAISNNIAKIRQMDAAQATLNRTMRAGAMMNMSKQYNKQATELSYVGQRLTMGLTLPLMAVGRIGFASLKKLDQEMIRTRKLLNDTGTDANFLENQMKVLGDRLDKISFKWGVSRELLQGLAGDFAELGISSPDVLANLVQITNEIEKLGNVDMTEANDLTRSIYQNLLKLRRVNDQDVTSEAALKTVTSQVRGAIALFNFAENKTSLSLKDIAQAFPEVQAAATTFGLSMQTTAALLVPMVSAGIKTGTAANALKVSLQKLIIPTRDVRKIYAALNQELGEKFPTSMEIGTKGIQQLVDAFRTLEKSSYGTMGTLQLFAKAFGVRQGTRMDLAIQQLAAFQAQIEKTDEAVKKASFNDKGEVINIGNAKAEGSVESKLLASLEKEVNAKLRAAKIDEIRLSNIEEIGRLNEMATETQLSKPNVFGKQTDEFTPRAKLIQKAQEDLLNTEEKRKKVNEQINLISTESGKILIGGAIGQGLMEQTMNDELKAVENSLNVQAGKVREAMKSIARDSTVAFGSVLTTIGPALQKIAIFIKNLSPGTKKLIGFFALFLLSIGPLVRVFSVVKQAAGLATFGMAKGMIAGRSRAMELNEELLRVNNTFLKLGKKNTVSEIGGKLVFTGKQKVFNRAQQLTTLQASQAARDPDARGLGARLESRKIRNLERRLGISSKTEANFAGLKPETTSTLKGIYASQASLVDAAKKAAAMAKDFAAQNKPTVMGQMFGNNNPLKGVQVATTKALDLIKNQSLISPQTILKKAGAGVAAATEKASAKVSVDPFMKTILSAIKSLLQEIARCTCAKNPLAAGKPSPTLGAVSSRGSPGTSGNGSGSTGATVDPVVAVSAQQKIADAFSAAKNAKTAGPTGGMFGLPNVSNAVAAAVAAATQSIVTPQQATAAVEKERVIAAGAVQDAKNAAAIANLQTQQPVAKIPAGPALPATGYGALFNNQAPISAISTAVSTAVAAATQSASNVVGKALPATGYGALFDPQKLTSAISAAIPAAVVKATQSATSVVGKPAAEPAAEKKSGKKSGQTLEEKEAEKAAKAAAKAAAKEKKAADDLAAKEEKAAARAAAREQKAVDKAAKTTVSVQDRLRERLHPQAYADIKSMGFNMKQATLSPRAPKVGSASFEFGKEQLKGMFERAGKAIPNSLANIPEILDAEGKKLRLSLDQIVKLFNSISKGTLTAAANQGPSGMTKQAVHSMFGVPLNSSLNADLRANLGGVTRVAPGTGTYLDLRREQGQDVRVLARQGYQERYNANPMNPENLGSLIPRTGRIGMNARGVEDPIVPIDRRANNQRARTILAESFPTTKDGTPSHVYSGLRREEYAATPGRHEKLLGAPVGFKQVKVGEQTRQIPTNITRMRTGDYIDFARMRKGQIDVAKAVSQAVKNLNEQRSSIVSGLKEKGSSTRQIAEVLKLKDLGKIQIKERINAVATAGNEKARNEALVKTQFTSSGASANADELIARTKGMATTPTARNKNTTEVTKRVAASVEKVAMGLEAERAKAIKDLTEAGSKASEKALGNLGLSKVQIKRRVSAAEQGLRPSIEKEVSANLSQKYAEANSKLQEARSKVATLPALTEARDKLEKEIAPLQEKSDANRKVRGIRGAQSRAEGVIASQKSETKKLTRSEPTRLKNISEIESIVAKERSAQQKATLKSLQKQQENLVGLRNAIAAYNQRAAKLAKVPAMTAKETLDLADKNKALTKANRLIREASSGTGVTKREEALARIETRIADSGLSKEQQDRVRNPIVPDPKPATPPGKTPQQAGQGYPEQPRDIVTTRKVGEVPKNVLPVISPAQQAVNDAQVRLANLMSVKTGLKQPPSPYASPADVEKIKTDLDAKLKALKLGKQSLDTAIQKAQDALKEAQQKLAASLAPKAGGGGVGGTSMVMDPMLGMTGPMLGARAGLVEKFGPKMPTMTTGSTAGSSSTVFDEIQKALGIPGDVMKQVKDALTSGFTNAQGDVRKAQTQLVGVGNASRAEITANLSGFIEALQSTLGLANKNVVAIAEAFRNSKLGSLETPALKAIRAGGAATPAATPVVSETTAAVSKTTKIFTAQDKASGAQVQQIANTLLQHNVKLQELLKFDDRTIRKVVELFADKKNPVAGVDPNKFTGISKLGLEEKAKALVKYLGDDQKSFVTYQELLSRITLTNTQAARAAGTAVKTQGDASSNSLKAATATIEATNQSTDVNVEGIIKASANLKSALAKAVTHPALVLGQTAERIREQQGAIPTPTIVTPVASQTVLAVQGLDAVVSNHIAALAGIVQNTASAIPSAASVASQVISGRRTPLNPLMPAGRKGDGVKYDRGVRTVKNPALSELLPSGFPRSGPSSPLRTSTSGQLVPDFAPAIAKFNIKASQVAASLAKINPRSVLATVAPASVATQQAGAVIAGNRPPIANFAVPGRTPAFDPSGVLNQIKSVVNKSLIVPPKVASIADIPIPKRGSARSYAIPEPPRFDKLTKLNSFVGKLVAITSRVTSSRAAQVLDGGGAGLMPGLTALKPGLLAPLFQRQNRFIPTDYEGQAKSRMVRALTRRNIDPTTSRQERIVGKEAKREGAAVRGVDRPNELVRMVQGRLPSQFIQSLSPMLNQFKAIRNSGVKASDVLRDFAPRIYKASVLAGSLLKKSAPIAARIGKELVKFPLTANVAALRAAQVITTVLTPSARTLADSLQKVGTKFAESIKKGFLDSSLAQNNPKTAKAVLFAGKALSASVQGTFNAITGSIGFAAIAIQSPRAAFDLARVNISSAALAFATAIREKGAAIQAALRAAGGGNMAVGAAKVAGRGALSLVGAPIRNAASAVAGKVQQSRPFMAVMGGPMVKADDGTASKKGGFFKSDKTYNAQGAVTGKSGGFVTNVAKMPFAAVAGGMKMIGGATSMAMTSVGGLANMMLYKLGPAGFLLMPIMAKVTAGLSAMGAKALLIVLPLLAIFVVFKVIKKGWASFSKYAGDAAKNFKAVKEVFVAIFDSLKTIFFDFFATLTGANKEASASTPEFGDNSSIAGMKRMGASIEDFSKKLLKFANAFKKIFDKYIAPFIYQFVSGFALILKGVVNVFMGIFNVVKGIYQKIRGEGDGGTSALKAGWEKLKDGVMNVLKGILKMFSGVIKILINIAFKYAEFYVQLWEFMIFAVIEILRHWYKFVISVITGILSAFAFLIDKLLEAFVFFQTLVVKIFKGILTIGVNVAAAMLKGFIWGIQKILDAFGGLLVGIGKVLGFIPAIIGGVFQNIADKVKNLEIGMFGMGVNVGKYIAPAFEKVADSFTAAADGLDSLMNAAKEGLGGSLDVISRGVDTSKEAIIAAFEFVAKNAITVYDKIGAMGDILRSTIADAGDAARDFADDIADGAKSIVGSASDAVNSLRKGIINWLDGFTKGGNIVEGIGKGAKEAIDDAVKNTDPSALKAAGEDIAKAIQQGLKDVKLNFFEKVIDNLGKALDKQKGKILDALNLQKDNQLKVFDDQIAAIDALAAAEEKLTATIEFENQKREAEAERSLQKKNYEKQRALAIYEGRIDDARTLDQEETKNRKDAEKAAKDADTGRNKTLQAEQRDTAKTIIGQQKTKATEAFDADIKAFEEFATNVLSKGTFTKAELESQFAEISKKAGEMSSSMKDSFSEFYTAMPGLIKSNTDSTIGFYSTGLDTLVGLAKAKFGLDTQTADPGSILGSTVAMLQGSASLFETMMPLVAEQYGKGTAALAKIGTDWADPTNENNPAKIYGKAISDANDAIVREFMKMKDSATSAFGEVIKSINAEVKDLAIAQAIKTATEGLKQNTIPTVSTIGSALDNTTYSYPKTAAELGLDPTQTTTYNDAMSGVALGSGGNNPFGTVSAAYMDQFRTGKPSPAQKLSLDEFKKQAGKDGFIGSGDKAAYVSNIKKALRFYGYDVGSTDDTLGTAAVEAVAQFQEKYQVGSGGQIKQKTAEALGLFNKPGVVSRYYGGPIPGASMVPGATSQAVPAVLHGGEYVINAKAATNLGSGFLDYLNSMKYGLQGSMMPGDEARTVLHGTARIPLQKFVKTDDYTSLESGFGYRLLQMFRENPGIGLGLGGGGRTASFAGNEFYRRYQIFPGIVDEEDPDTYADIRAAKLKFNPEDGQYYKLKPNNMAVAVPNSSYHILGKAADLVGDLALAGRVTKEYSLVQVLGTGEEHHFQPTGTPKGKRGLDYLLKEYNLDAIKTPLNSSIMGFLDNFLASNAKKQPAAIRTALDRLVKDFFFQMGDQERASQIKVLPEIPYQNAERQLTPEIPYALAGKQLTPEIPYSLSTQAPQVDKPQSTLKAKTVVSKIMKPIISTIDKPAIASIIKAVVNKEEHVSIKPEQINTLKNAISSPKVSTFSSEPVAKQNKGYSAQNLSEDTFRKQAGKNGFIDANTKASYVSNVKKALRFYGYDVNSSDVMGAAAAAAVMQFQSEYGIGGNGKLNLATARSLGLFGQDGVVKRYYGGPVKRMMGGPIKRMMGGPVGAYGAGGDVPGFAMQAVPALLHGGEYVINSKAVQNLGSGFLQYINNLKNGMPKFGIPTPNMPNVNVNQTVNVNGGNSENISNYNFYVDNFIGEDKWFEGMMNEYNVKVIPNKQKSAGLESRVIRSYNGINKGI
jgi:hypothetical protein